MSHRGMPCVKSIKDARRAAANKRNEAYNLLTTQQKLDRLPEGHCERQRARLLKRLEEEKKQSGADKKA